MTAELVFKTASPAAIEWWEGIRARLDGDRLNRIALAEELTAALGPGHDGDLRRLYAITTWEGSDLVTGVEAVGAEWTDPPAGWRFDRKTQHLVPALRTDEGRAALKRLQAVSGTPWRTGSEAVGIPRRISIPRPPGPTDGMVHEAGIFFDVEPRVLYQLWSTTAVYDEVVAKQANARGVEWAEVTRAEWSVVAARRSQ